MVSGFFLLMILNVPCVSVKKMKLMMIVNVACIKKEKELKTKEVKNC